jgi:hypothetical protein
MNGLALPTLQLLQALPRGRRFDEQRLRTVAQSLAISMNGAVQRVRVLVGKKLVIEHIVLDGEGKFDRFEWEVKA